MFKQIWRFAIAVFYGLLATFGPTVQKPEGKQ